MCLKKLKNNNDNIQKVNLLVKLVYFLNLLKINKNLVSHL